jgi:uncharacterized delta-60 repeat protein
MNPKRIRTLKPTLELLEDRCVPSAGFLDPTFNTTGVVTTQVAQLSGGLASAVAIYAPGTANAGKIVAVGEGADSHGNGDFGLVRYNPNGSLDSTFGTGGIVNQSLSSSNSNATAVALVGDKILASGSAYTKGGNSVNFALARFNADGSLDQSFGTKGLVQTSFGKYAAEANAMAVQADGKIVVSGTVGVTGAKSFSIELAVARYTPNGALDTSFGTSGIKIIDVGESLENEGMFAGTQSLVLSGDRIDLVGRGHSSLNVYVTQLTATGQVDPTFGAGGMVTVGQGFQPSLTVQPDGKLVAASYNSNSSPAGIHVTRLLATGSPDTGFGTGGTATVPWSTIGWNNKSNAVKVDPLGRFVIGGSQGLDVDIKLFVIRLTSTGSLDSTFGVGGIGTSGNLVNLNLTLPHVAMELQPDGKPVLVSTTQDSKFAVARFDGDPALQISSFTASPNPVTAASSVTLTASNLTDTNPGATITQVAFDSIDNSGNQHLLGYAAQTSPGVWTLSFSPSTFSLTSGTYTLFAQAEDSYGVFSDPFALTLTIQ